MTKINIQPTATSQWYSAVTDACNARSITISTDIESYLVYLLEKNTVSTQLLSKIVGLEFMEAIDANGRVQQYKLKEVADSCLVLSGLFPEIAKRRRLNLNYYIDLGKASYTSLALTNLSSNNYLYQEIADEFIKLVELMLAMRDSGNNINSFLSIESAYELWQKYGSSYALSLLTKNDKHILTNLGSKKDSKH